MYYYRHFGLSNPPFEMTGKPNSLYMSKAHTEGLAALEWGLLHEPGQFTLLMGEAGTGKTTLINVLLSRHFQCIANADGRPIYSIRTSDLARITYVMNPKLGFEEMLRVILEQLGYPPTSSMTKLELLRQFELIFGQLRPRERIAIIVDEAQALSDETLEELRLFSNYGQYGKGHLEILLVGQPELLTRLMEPSLRQFHQRIGARAMLNPLQREEAFEYIAHKLRENGGSTKEIFSQRALKLLVDHSHGIPRQLNLLCNSALIRTYGSGLRWVTIEVAREAVREYENLAKTAEKFRKPIGRQALHSIIARPAIPLLGVGLVALVGFYALGVRMPDIALMASGIANTNVRQYREAHDSSQNALPLIKASGDSVADNPLRSSPANGPLTLSASHIANNEVTKRAQHDALAIPRLASAQMSRAPSFASAPISNATQADNAAAPKSLKTSLPATISPTIIEGSGESKPAAVPAHHSRNRRETPPKPRNLVIQSKVQLVLQSLPRLKNVRATMTQPGVIVLEGEVLDNDAKAAAEQAVVGVVGIKHVINALTTESLQWLLAQIRINQALEQSGFPLVSVKVILKTVKISGQVNSDADKDRAVAVVNAAEPDLTVDRNLINVVSAGF